MRNGKRVAFPTLKGQSSSSFCFDIVLTFIPHVGTQYNTYIVAFLQWEFHLSLMVVCGLKMYMLELYTNWKRIIASFLRLQSFLFWYTHFAGHPVCHREFRYRIFLCIVLLFFSLALQIGKFCVVNRLHA